MDSHDLTVRQREALALAAKGLTQDAIARQMFVTKRTVTKHLRDAGDRLGAQNTTQAVAVAVALGLVVFEWPVRVVPSA